MKKTKSFKLRSPEFYKAAIDALEGRRTKLEIWYEVWPVNYCLPPGDPDRYDEPVPDMIGSISDGYPDE
jgi:hypothetical protein